MASAHSKIRLELVDPTSPHAQALIEELSALLEATYGSSGRDGYRPADEEASDFVIAWQGEDPVGCGAVRPLPDEQGIAEVKRMYSRPGTSGVGRAILAHLERIARESGFTSIWLETRRANTRAVAFYRAAGYRARDPYGKYVGRPEAICMEKLL